MIEPVTAVPIRRVNEKNLDALIEREWLVTNGLGGYASGTVAGVTTRRYHGLLVAAHAAPLGRVMMLNHLLETFRFPDHSSAKFGGSERPGGALEVFGSDIFSEFRYEMGLPVWRYETQGHVFEKRVFMPHHRNTVHIEYRLLSGPGPIRVKLRPSVHFRGHDDPVSVRDAESYVLTAKDSNYELTAPGPYPSLKLWIDGGNSAFVLDGITSPEVLYRVEEHRGYEGVGIRWSPGEFRTWMSPEKPVVLSASTETWEHALALAPQETLEAEHERRRGLLQQAPPALREGLAAELVLAADQFIIAPATRAADLARAVAAGGQARTVIAGYHWFTDWGRDTMISLDGLTLCTGRHAEAREILQTFASHVKDGLIPNFFPDRRNVGVYHTADATLWFFQAIHRYVEVSGDRQFLRTVLPTMLDILQKHEAGTRFGIGVDPEDGLLKQGAEGYQLTWMDAKCGDWVVTPRRGKAVEINALWYNALRLTEGWLRQEKEPAEHIAGLADRAYASFNRRFWCEPEQGLYDVVDTPEGTNDPACRPNQLFAISLTFPVLDRELWATVVNTCQARLLTPLGLRTLAPGHPDYKSKYYGDLRSRDAAYHQGTVWAWLTGPFIDAWMKAFPERKSECPAMFSGFNRHLSEACLGTISEVFDAEDPYKPGGCAAQAWSVAEVLRCLWNCRE